MTHGPAVDTQALAGREGRDRRLRELLPFRPLAIYLGLDLVPLVDPDIGGDFMERLGALRIKVAGETGFVFPGVALADDRNAPPQGYRIQVFDRVCGAGELLMGLWLATAPEGTYPTPPVGLPGSDPATGRPGVWIPAGAYDAALEDGFVLRTPAEVLIDHLAHVMTRHATSLLSLEETKLMLDALAETAPTLVRDVLPGCMPLPELNRELGALLARGRSIRDLADVVERLVGARSCGESGGSEIAARSCFPPPDLPEPTAVPEDVIKATVAPPALVVELGPDLAASADPAIKGDLLDGVADLRDAVFRELGLVLPRIAFRQDAGLCEGEYAVAVRGRLVAQGIVWPDPRASSADRLLQRIGEAAKAHAAELLDLEETRRLAERARDIDPDLAPLAPAALPQLQVALQAILRGGGSLGDPPQLLRTFVPRPLASGLPAPAPPPAAESWRPLPILFQRLRAAEGSPDRLPAAHLASQAISDCQELLGQLHDKEAAERFADALAALDSLEATAATAEDVAQAAGRLKLARALLLPWEGSYLASLDCADGARRAAATPAQALAADVAGHLLCGEFLRATGKPKWAWPCLRAAEGALATLAGMAEAWREDAFSRNAWVLVDLDLSATPARMAQLRGELMVADGDGGAATPFLELACADLRNRISDGREDLLAPYFATLRALAEARMAAGLATGAAEVTRELHAARERLRTARRDRGTRALRPRGADSSGPGELPEAPELADLTLADFWTAVDLAAQRAPVTVDHALRREALPALHARVRAGGGELGAIWRILGELALG